ncbi:MAG: peptidylprolyl isomerase [Bacteroidales bacterium]|nr:peptidylprolyl isomerase [Bacteroidales bacterium]
MKHLILALVFINCLSFAALSQDAVLLTIDNQPVMKSEFERIFRKNNNVEGYESKSPAEYLEMFINFKLKVLEARKLGYDTLDSFVNELAGYREQLSKPYLQDRNLIDRLVLEAYNRTLTEVDASHIMVKLPAETKPADTLDAYNKAMNIRKRLLSGEAFDKIAREESEDPSAKVNGGNLGWFSAFSMVYPFENAAYNTPVGQFSMPVKSKYGYHIIRVNGRRQALGEIRLAHILIRSGKNENQEAVNKAKEKANACYKQLQEGASFADMVKQYSEDAGSARNAGQMRWLRSGELPADIEAKVFALTDSGSYTVPVQSDYGWHIFQLLGKRPLASFDQIKPQIEERIMMDERGKKTEEAFFAALMQEHKVIKYPENITDIAGMLDKAIYSGAWKPGLATDLIEPVFAVDNQEYSQKELIDFILKTNRYNKKLGFADIVNSKCDELVRISLMAHEKQLLEEKYPNFKYLMEEYHDGILLFNIMDRNVWSMAVNDSAGLRSFYRQHEKEYMWNERADVSLYTVRDPLYLKSATKYARKRVKKSGSVSEYLKNVCSNDSINCVEVVDRRIEKGESTPYGEFVWEKGTVKTMAQANLTRLLVVNSIIPPSPKAFDDVQGQVTADYQNFLDKQWIDSLRAKYAVVVNQDVLKQVK